MAIDSKGDIYKCHRVLGKPQYKSGNIWNGIENNEIFKTFCTEELGHKECYECKLLPICQGGCVINRVLYDHEHSCTPIKAVYKDLIQKFVINNQR